MSDKDETSKLAEQLEEKEMELLNIQTNIITLEDQVAKLTSSNKQLQRVIANLEDQLQKKTMEMYHMSIQKEQEKNELRESLQIQQFEEISKELENTKEELSRTQHNFKNLQNRFSRAEGDFNERIEQKEHETQKMLEKYSHHDEETKKFEKMLNDKEVRINSLLKQIDDINNKHSGSAEKILLIEKENKNTTEELVKLQQEHKNAQETLRQQKGDLDHYVKTIASRNDEIKTITEEKEKTKQEYLEVHTTWKNIQAEHDKLVNAKRDAETIIIQKNTIISDLNSELKKIEKEMQKLNDKYKRRKPKNDLEEDFLVELAKKDHELDDLLESLQTKDENINKLEQEVEKLKSNLQNKVESVTKDFNQRLENKERDMNTLSSRLRDKSTELDDHKRQISQLQSKINDHVKGIDYNVVQQNEVIHNSLSSEIKELKHKSSEDKLSIQNLENKVSQKENQVSQLSASLEQKTGRVESMQKLLDSKTEQILEYNKKVQDLQTQISKLNVTLVQKDKEIQSTETKVEAGLPHIELQKRDTKIRELEIVLESERKKNRASPQVVTNDEQMFDIINKKDVHIAELERDIQQMKMGTNTRELEKQILVLNAKLSEKEKMLSTVNNSKYVKHLEGVVNDINTKMKLLEENHSRQLQEKDMFITMLKNNNVK